MKLKQPHILQFNLLRHVKQQNIGLGFVRQMRTVVHQRAGISPKIVKDLMLIIKIDQKPVKQRFFAYFIIEFFGAGLVAGQTKGGII